MLSIKFLQNMFTDETQPDWLKRNLEMHATHEDNYRLFLEARVIMPSINGSNFRPHVTFDEWANNGGQPYTSEEKLERTKDALYLKNVRGIDINPYTNPYSEEYNPMRASTIRNSARQNRALHNELDEKPWEEARKNLGFLHKAGEDTEEQTEALIKEECRMAAEFGLQSAVEELSEAKSQEHFTYLRGQVEKYQDMVSKYPDPFNG